MKNLASAASKSDVFFPSVGDTVLFHTYPTGTPCRMITGRVEDEDGDSLLVSTTRRVRGTRKLEKVRLYVEDIADMELVSTSL